MAALACLFTSPALLGEFSPASCWQGVEQIWNLPEPLPQDAPLLEVFAAAVAELCADAECVGIKLSGGLDSLAVLLHVMALCPDRRVVAYTTDLVDDLRTSTADVVRRMLRELEAEVEAVIVDPASCVASPEWSPHGPRLDALPKVNAAVAKHAAAHGVDVLLSGDGADELLGVPRFATAELTKHRGLLAGVRYAWDSRKAGPGLPGEALSIIAACFPRRMRARWYWAANWPQWCEPTIADVVPEPLANQARQWADHWIVDHIGNHVNFERSWAQCDAFDAFWPRAYIPASGPIPEASPFLHEDVVAAARALPLAARYEATMPTPYLRCKAAVVGLLPPHIIPTLPRRKQYYSQALAASVNAPLETPVASAAGLIDPKRLATTTDIATRMTAAAIEQWLQGAVAAGAVVPHSADADH